MRALALTLACAAASFAQAPPKWRIKFFHDEDKTAMSFVDMKFVSGRLGMAVGVLTNTVQRERQSPVAVVTTDGGKTWARKKLPEVPRSMFALGETVWVMAANDGLYRSGDFGNNWRKVSTLKGCLRVHFLDEKRGFAVGVRKSVWRTVDGGAKWTAVPEAAELKTKPENSVYTSISFIDQKRAMIMGFSQPPRRRMPRAPEWMDPDNAPSQVPHVFMVLETKDGGDKWVGQTASVFGNVTQLAASPKVGLTLVEYGEGFAWPSEVMMIQWGQGTNKRVFREKNRAVRDVAIDAMGKGYLVAIERPGTVSALPIPGKLHVLESLDLEKWAEVDVDYKAVANDAVMAIAPDDGRFIATDTGMILKFE